MAPVTHSRRAPYLLVCAVLSVSLPLFADQPPDRVWVGGIRGTAEPKKCAVASVKAAEPARISAAPSPFLARQVRIFSSSCTARCEFQYLAFEME